MLGLEEEVFFIQRREGKDAKEKKNNQWRPRLGLGFTDAFPTTTTRPDLLGFIVFFLIANYTLPLTASDRVNQSRNTGTLDRARQKTERIGGEAISWSIKLPRGREEEIE